jgi:nitric oxide reductase NorE protein
VASLFGSYRFMSPYCFLLVLLFFRYHKSMEPLVFKQETSFLSLPLGITYTLILLLSGWAIAEAQAHYKGFAQKKGQLYHLFGLLLGGLFLGMKGFDFIDKIAKGKSFGDSSFWALYWFFKWFSFYSRAHWDFFFF